MGGGGLLDTGPREEEEGEPPEPNTQSWGRGDLLCPEGFENAKLSQVLLKSQGRSSEIPSPSEKSAVLLSACSSPHTGLWPNLQKALLPGVLALGMEKS